MTFVRNYVEQCLDGISILGWQFEFALFNGMPSSMPIADWLSVCHDADTYTEQRNYYSGDPTCEVCHQVCMVHAVPRVRGERVVQPRGCA